MKRLDFCYRNLTETATCSLVRVAPPRAAILFAVPVIIYVLQCVRAVASLCQRELRIFYVVLTHIFAAANSESVGLLCIFLCSVTWAAALCAAAISIINCIWYCDLLLRLLFYFCEPRTLIVYATLEMLHSWPQLEVLRSQLLFATPMTDDRWRKAMKYKIRRRHERSFTCQRCFARRLFTVLFARANGNLIRTAPMNE